MADKLLTVKEAAKKLGLAPVTVRKWCKKGTVFPNASLRRYGVMVWLIPESDLEGVESRRPRVGRPLRDGGNRIVRVVVDGNESAKFTNTAEGLRKAVIAAREARNIVTSDPDCVRILLNDTDITARLLDEN